MERQQDKENRKVTKQNRILSSKNTLGANNKYKQKHSRYSPNQQSDSSTHKKHSNNQLASVRSQTRLQQPNFTGQELNMPHNQQQISGNAGSQTQRPSSRNMNMPQNYTSKQQQQQLLPQQNTVSSSNYNLVLYDSSTTDIFKSKNLIKNQHLPTLNHHPSSNGLLSQRGGHSNKNQTIDNKELQHQKRKLNFDEQHQNYLDEENDCPSLDQYEEEDQNDLMYCDNQQVKNNNKLQEIVDGMFASSTDEDPFVTGKFCDNTGHAKQFLFKYSNNNSKNSTMRFN
eukprot:403331658